MRGSQPHHSKPESSEEPDEDLEEDHAPLCPLCGRCHDMPLLLPCSHILCGRCLTQKARSDELRHASRPSCAVLCPSCRHAVQLPCSDWSDAAGCLPLYPAVTFDPEEDVPGGSVDLSEEEMARSVSGLVFSLDRSTSAPPLQISNSALTATYKGIWDELGNGARYPQVCGDVEIHRGQYYWEVDVCNSTLYRIGVTSLAGDRAWWFERRGSAFHAVFDGRSERLVSAPPGLKTLGVFLNVGGASVTFHNPVTQELLAAIPSRFTTPLCPAFQLGQGRIKLRPGLPPPNHVFLGRRSSYRGTERAWPGRWRQGVAFGSVRAVIQKFEKIADSCVKV